MTTTDTSTIPAAIEHALIDGDLSGLSVEQRGTYYQSVCESLGLNPLTQPFGYLVLNGKLRLYALKACTDQLRAIHKISLEILTMQTDRELFIVHVRARDQAGRVDEDVGFAVLATLKGEALGNAQLKAITKAKRRVTLSICGLGVLDETEVATIPEARTYTAETVPLPAPSSEPTRASVPMALPAVSEHPTAEDIDRLFATAEACRAPKDAFGTQLRRIMGLPGETRISKKFLREAMTVQHYQAALKFYDDLLRRQVEEDVPIHEPSPAPSPPAVQDVPETPQDAPQDTIVASPEGTQPRAHGRRPRTTRTPRRKPGSGLKWRRGRYPSRRRKSNT